MVYFRNEIVKFPRHFDENVDKITLINEVSNEEITLEVENISEDIRSYSFDFTEVELPNGTYLYKLGKDCGLLQVGDYGVGDTSTYENPNKKIVYYEG